MLVTILLPHPTNIRQWSVISFHEVSVSNASTIYIAPLLNCILKGDSFQYVMVYNFTTMYTMYYRSYFLIHVAISSIFKNQHST
jgi:hypothetical protein